MTKTISSLNEIKKISSKVYVRWSKSIALDNKRGYSLRSGTSREGGLSACEINTTWSDWRILRQLGEYFFCGGYCWIVTGDVVGIGGDNEPLLSNVKVIGKVSKTLLNIDWKVMQRDEMISDLHEKLTKITDPIGRQITQDALDKLLKG